MNKISIIIPVYNVEEYLPRCIDSVLKQNNIELEILLINDGSTDTSGYICEDYSKQDKRVRVFHQENAGVSSARNNGIVNASGDWICFVDADDWIEHNSLEKIVSINDINFTDIIIARSHLNKNGVSINEIHPFNKNMEGKYFDGIELAINENYIRGCAWGALYKRDFLLSYNIFFPLDLSIGEDSIFYSLCTIYASTISFSYVHFYNVFEREGSATRSWTFKKITGMVENISYLNNYINSHRELSRDALDVLNYRKYGIISNIYNNFHHTFSLKNYFFLRGRIKEEFKSKLRIINIHKNKRKIQMLNFSIDIFAGMTMLNFKLKQILNKNDDLFN